MLYLAIPAHNEVATIGVLLWRIRTVLAEFPREYEVVVYDDASTDETAVVATQYEQAMPVTVLRGQKPLGYAGAVDALLRHIAQQTRYPRRDAVLLLQGDFTDPPGIVPEFARRFEGGADLVVGERRAVADAPVAVKRLFRGAQWAMRPFVRVDGVKDITASMRLVRISALRDALRAVGDTPLVTGDTWTANADLLLRLAPHARRVESVLMEPTYGVRMRETRRVALRDALSALKWAWGARGRRASVGSSAEPAPDSERRTGRQAAGRRREEPAELSIDRLREKVRDRDGTRGLDGEPERPRDKRRGRDRERERPTDRPTAGSDREGGRDRDRDRDRERPVREGRAERVERPPRAESSSERPAKPRRERTERPERVREERTGADARPPRPPRAERPPRPKREDTRPASADPLELDDPFAPPASRVDPLTRALEAPAGPAAPTWTPPAASAPSSDGSPTRERADQDASDLSAEVGAEASAEADAEHEVDDAEGMDGSEGAEGEIRRKRRRNRRSRRGRRRRESSDGSEGGGDENQPDDGMGSESGPVDRESRRDESEDEREDDGSENAADAVDGDGPGGEDGSPRARRRGRRGRRGGARRSRGRRDRGDGSEGGGEGDSGPGAGERDAPSDD